MSLNNRRYVSINQSNPDILQCMKILPLMAELKISATFSHARRLISQGSVKLDGIVIKSDEKIIRLDGRTLTVGRNMDYYIVVSEPDEPTEIMVNTWPWSQICSECKNGVLMNDIENYGCSAYTCSKGIDITHNLECESFEEKE